MKKLICIPVLALLGSCAITGKNLPPVQTNKPAPVPNVQPAPMALTDVEWKVYTATELRAELDRAPKDAIFYVLTPNEFRNLTLNLTEMRRFIEDQRDINQALIAAIEINASK